MLCPVNIVCYTHISTYSERFIFFQQGPQSFTLVLFNLESDHNRVSFINGDVKRYSWTRVVILRFNQVECEKDWDNYFRHLIFTYSTLAKIVTGALMFNFVLLKDLLLAETHD